MKLRHPWLIRWAAFFLTLLIRAWIATLRRRVVQGGVGQPTDARRERYIYAVWHETLLTVMWIRTRAALLISQHADGELVAQVGRFLGYTAVRGSTTRGGEQALEDMLTASRTHHLLITPDGPRGPRQTFQAGAIYVASRTGLPIVLLAVGFSHASRARSWDRFAVPVPFSTMYGVMSDPIVIPPNLSRRLREELRAEVQARFDELTAAAERWAAGGPRPVSSLPALERTLRAA